MCDTIACNDIGVGDSGDVTIRCLEPNSASVLDDSELSARNSRYLLAIREVVCRVAATNYVSKQDLQQSIRV